MTNYDSRLASAVHSSLILSTCARAVSSSDDRSYSSVGHMVRSCSSVRIASHTSSSISCRHRRILRSSNVQPRMASCLDLEPEAHAWAKNSCSAASAQAQLASCSLHASPSASAKAASTSSHTMTAPSRQSSSFSRAISYPCSSAATAGEGDGALRKSANRNQHHNKGASPDRR
jgi:hypothetical protein